MVATIYSCATCNRIFDDDDENMHYIADGSLVCIRCEELPQEPHRNGLTLAEVLQAFQRELYLPNPDAINVNLAAYAANLLPGDPVWVLNVGASSGGKTELQMPLTGLRHIHEVSEITEAGLLSGTPQGDKEDAATGGLLREMGEFGIILAKDFTSILEMRSDRLKPLLAAFREIHDGSWIRRLGTGGGQSYSWTGKAGFIGACTSAIDLAHDVNSVMGQRFLLNRIPELDPIQQAMTASESVDEVTNMRQGFRGIVKAYVDSLGIQDYIAKKPEMHPTETVIIANLSALVAAARSGVVRDNYRREIVQVMETEGTGRLARSLTQFFRGAQLIGNSPDEAMRLTIGLGLGSIPKTRRTVFDVLQPGERYDVLQVMCLTALPETTVRRALEDLAVHRVLVREDTPQKWRLSTETIQRMAVLNLFP
jgi:hypothetical protein